MSTNNVPYTHFSIKPVMYGDGCDTVSYDRLQDLNGADPDAWGLYGYAPGQPSEHIADFAHYSEAVATYSALTGFGTPKEPQALHELPGRAIPALAPPVVVVKVEDGVVQAVWSSVAGTDVSVVDLDVVAGLDDAETDSIYDQAGLGSADEFEARIASGQLIPVY